MQGGALYWDYIEPFLSDDTIFGGNKALLYGDDIACFP